MTFTYDLLDHPLAIAGSDNQTDYVYSADGRKLRATHTQGNNRILIGSNGQRDQYSHYYPYGGLMGDISTNDAHSYKYGGKELDRDFGIDLFDFEARQYDAKLPAFTSIDPLAEKYYGISPYAYCAGDPVNCVDPDGREIQGQSNSDARQFRKDIFTVLADDKFKNIRSLINVKGNSFKQIDLEKLQAAKEGIDLSVDEETFLSMVVNAINTIETTYKVEYVDVGSDTSMDGADAFRNHMSKELGENTAKSLLKPDGSLSSNVVMRLRGGGLNVPTNGGSHSFIHSSFPLDPNVRVANAFHEVLGHGIPAAKGIFGAENNSNAIRADNLVRRILGIPQRDGRDHGGSGIEYRNLPYNLPLIH